MFSTFVQTLNQMSFAAPTAYVYNPLDYAGLAYQQYWDRYAPGGKRVVMMGMNPGPWGMAQSGIPFGEVATVRDWLGISAAISRPNREHPQRPVLGLACQRSEVSGKRLWGYLKERYGRPEEFFRFAFVVNYCPLLFLEESGRNLTPDKLRKSEREPLLLACDDALAESLASLQPEHVIGVGKWAEGRARHVIESRGLPMTVSSVPHPSPANPAANRGWGDELGRELARFEP